MTDIGWTKELIKNLKILKAKAWRDTWLHRENSQYLDNNYDWESAAAFCASFFSGIVQIFRSPLIYVQITAILLNFISSFLQFHIKFKDYPTLIEKHKIATSRFSGIYNKISGQESVPVEKRQRATDFYAWISAGYETLHVTAPEIDDVVWDTYHRKFKDKKAYKIIEEDEFDISSQSSEGKPDNPVAENSLSEPIDRNISPDPSPDTGDISSDSDSNNLEEIVVVKSSEQQPEEKINEELLRQEKKRETYDRNRLNYEMNRMDSNVNSFATAFELFSMNNRCLIDDSEMRNPSFDDKKSKK